MTTLYKKFEKAQEYPFPILKVGTRISDAGTMAVAHDVSLLREVLSHREAELFDRIHDAIKEDVSALADALGADKDPEGYWVQHIVWSIMERMLRPDEEHRVSDPRVCLLELLEEAEREAIAAAR